MSCGCSTPRRASFGASAPLAALLAAWDCGSARFRRG
jgi:hypothetical protein